jgi:hypothetical protein
MTIMTMTIMTMTMMTMDAEDYDTVANCDILALVLL